MGICSVCSRIFLKIFFENFHSKSCIFQRRSPPLRPTKEVWVEGSIPLKGKIFSCPFRVLLFNIRIKINLCIKNRQEIFWMGKRSRKKFFFSKNPDIKNTELCFFSNKFIYDFPYFFSFLFYVKRVFSANGPEWPLFGPARPQRQCAHSSAGS